MTRPALLAAKYGLFELFSGFSVGRTREYGMVLFTTKIRRRTFLVSLLPLLVLSLPWFGWAHGASQRISEYVHNSWRTEDGLPQNTVQTILQTSDGYLWLGTQEGLVRFDGIQFTVFNKANTRTFRLNDIRSLAQDRQGNLWIGSFGGGLIQYRNGALR